MLAGPLATRSTACSPSKANCDGSSFRLQHLPQDQPVHRVVFRCEQAQATQPALACACLRLGAMGQGVQKPKGGERAAQQEGVHGQRCAVLPHWADTHVGQVYDQGLAGCLQSELAVCVPRAR